MLRPLLWPGLAALLLLARLPVVLGWGVDGHNAVGMTTMSAMKGQPLATLKKLLGGKDAVDVGHWAHLVGDKYPELKELHFQQHSGERPGSCDKLDFSLCTGGRCIVRAVQHFYSRLTEGEAVELDIPHDLVFTDSDAIKFLINLIADLHMPMSVAFASDQNGRNISGTYVERTIQKPTTVYDFWNTDLVTRLSEDRASFWNSGWTHVKNLGNDQYTVEKAKWSSSTPVERLATIELWASESLKLGCLQAYTAGKPNGGDLKPGFRILQSDYRNLYDFLQRRILTAGMRTAVVLNHILETQPTIKLRQGSGIQVAVESPAVKSVSTPVWIRALVINVFILLILALVFLYISRYYGRPASPKVDSSRGAPTSKGYDKRA